MAHALTKFFLSAALATSVAFSIPSTTVYVRPPETGTVIEAEVTAYNSEPEQTDDTPFITASGTHVHDGTIACPQVYPFGTIVRIEGKAYTCEDLMAKKYRDKNYFDIWMSDAEAAKKWGRKTLDVYILQ